MISTYFVTGKADGHLELLYSNELLIAIKLEFKQALNEAAFRKIIAELPYLESKLADWVQSTGLSVEKQAAANTKIALFCSYYMKYKNGQKYKATRIDGSRIKDFKVNDDILNIYFTSTNFLFVGEKGSAGRHSVMNFCTYYNQVLAELATNGKNKHPDHWSLAYENKLGTQNELYEYWAHLRSLGLTPKKDRVGKTIEWIKK